MTKRSEYSRPGVYRILCVANGKVYIGISLNVQKRWTRHRWELNRAQHHCAHFQRAWAKYGADTFGWEVVEWAPDGLGDDDLVEWLIQREIDMLTTHHPDYFNTMEAGPRGMHRASEELRAQLSAERKARWMDPEYRARLSASHREYWANPDAKAAHSAAIRAGLQTPEYRAYRSAHTKERWADGGDLRKTQSAARRRNWKDPEYRAQQVASRLASWQDPEVRAKRESAIKASWQDPEKAERRRVGIAAALAAKPSLIRLARAMLQANPDAAMTGTDLALYAAGKLPKDPSLDTCAATLGNLAKRGEAEKAPYGYRWKPQEETK